ncbi:unnamed protein product [Cuscuta europaea]|uniref:Uncharacterized protein n=1 Tax=Cuscuta europaea TaxID=41803 RepID=A0A9P1DY87_CUSEU|nr:unnamed protein product [Cuscuta europaea]
MKTLNFENLKTVLNSPESRDSPVSVSSQKSILHACKSINSQFMQSSTKNDNLQKSKKRICCWIGFERRFQQYNFYRFSFTNKITGAKLYIEENMKKSRAILRKIRKIADTFNLFHASALMPTDRPQILNNQKTIAVMKKQIED